MTGTDMAAGEPGVVYELDAQLDDRHPHLGPDYPLLPGDLLTWNPRDGWIKQAPGLGVSGLRITDADMTHLTPTDKRWVV